MYVIVVLENLFTLYEYSQINYQKKIFLFKTYFIRKKIDIEDIEENTNGVCLCVDDDGEYKEFFQFSVAPSDGL